MKTKELINRVNGVQGIAAYNEGHWVTFYEIGQTFPFYTMDKKNVDFGQGISNFANILDTNMSRLSYVIDAIREYLETPLADREEEKRYYLRNVSPLLRGSGRGYLAKNKDTLEYYALSLKCSEEFYQTIFTESEIAEMDITGFVKEPVE